MNPKYLNVQNNVFASTASTYASAPHAAITDAMISMAEMWVLALGQTISMKIVEPQLGGFMTIGSGDYQKVPISDNQLVYHLLGGRYDQTYVTSRCNIISVNTTDLKSPVTIPTELAPSLDWTQRPRTANWDTYYDPDKSWSEVPNTNWSSVFSTEGNKDDYRIWWRGLQIEGPGNQAAAANDSLLAFVIPPNTSTSSDYAMNVSLCSASAGWASSTLNITADGQDPNRVSSGLSKTNQSTSAGAYKWFRHHIDNTKHGVGSAFEYPIFPQRPISIAQSWLDLLNPTIPAAENATQNTTVFNALVRASGIMSNDTITLASIISTMLANGVSRTGFYANLTGTVATDSMSNEEDSLRLSDRWLKSSDVLTIDPSREGEYTMFKKDTFVVGYSFKMRGTPSILAVIVLLAYCALALGYTVYTILIGVSADNWSSAMDITALAMNSPPSEAFRNTGAGITGMGVYGTQAKVRVLSGKTEPGDSDYENVHDEGEERLALILDEGASESRSDVGLVRKNREYG